MAEDTDFWWRNVNMAKYEEAKVWRLSQTSASAPPPAPVAPVVSAMDDSVSAPVSPPVPAAVARPAAKPVAKPAKKSSKSTSTGARRQSEADSSRQQPAAPSPPTLEHADSTVDSEPSMESPNIDNPEEPKWYKSIKTNTKKRPSAGIDAHFNLLRSGIQNCTKAASQSLALPCAELEKINNALHQLPFLDVNGLTLRTYRCLHNDGGCALPQLFCSKYANGVQYPWYIVEDAAELYTKWWSQDFDPDLFRGIDVGRKKDKRLGREAAAPKIISNYPKKRSGRFFGNGHLRNGQWWPTQLSAVRDGAHSATIAGICGKVDEGGAFSCVMSGGPHPNVDHGEEVWYYGTQSDDPAEATAATQLMKKSIETQKPVRLLRSAKMTDSEYKPAEGMRYDGLYKVVSFEITDLAKQVHRFHLVREPEQGTIRYQGPEIRPTVEELAALDKAKKERGYLV